MPYPLIPARGYCVLTLWKCGSWRGALSLFDHNYLRCHYVHIT